MTRSRMRRWLKMSEIVIVIAITATTLVGKIIDKRGGHS